MDRRGFLLSASATATALTVRRIFGAEPRYRIGYTTNTRGFDPATTWGGEDPFRGFAEAHEVGFNYVEAFATALSSFYPDDVDGLKKRIDEMGVRFAAVTGGSRGGNTHFENPAARQAVIENHLGVVRFSRKFGCDHQKTNLGSRRPEGTTQEDLKNIAETVEILGRRSLEEEGIPFGVHAHLGSQFQSQSEIDYVMANTDPKHVRFVLDTGHITMAGMDPIALAKKLENRVVEFHLKDTKPEDHGGSRNVPGRDRDQMKDPYFFPMGNGGVDFLALKAHLDLIQWRGFLVVELDTSPFRTPKESAHVTANYLQKTMKIPL
ncbi:MAG: sugar phosphate isomerase/epimerase [Bryobacteraceae bacterium]|jgi:inosose dehydratase